MNENFYIGQIFEGSYPPDAAVWCNANNAFIDVIGTKKYEIKAVPEPPEPTHDDIKQMRAEAYRNEVDPITSHIQRLRDDDPESEEIAELIAERTAKVAEIKTRFPYPDEQQGV